MKKVCNVARDSSTGEIDDWQPICAKSMQDSVCRSASDMMETDASRLCARHRDHTL